MWSVDGGTNQERGPDCLSVAQWKGSRSMAVLVLTEWGLWEEGLHVEALLEHVQVPGFSTTGRTRLGQREGKPSTCDLQLRP